MRSRNSRHYQQQQEEKVEVEVEILGHGHAPLRPWRAFSEIDDELAERKLKKATAG